MSGKIILRAYELYIKQKNTANKTVFKFGTNQLRFHIVPVGFWTHLPILLNQSVSKLLIGTLDPGSVASKHVATLQMIRHAVNEIVCCFLL